MTKDEIQFWMLIAFAVVFILSSYKTYIMFSAPAEGKSTKHQQDDYLAIITDFIKQDSFSNATIEELFTSLKSSDVLQADEYKNFNQNRFNQLIQQLFFIYEVDSLDGLIKSIKNAS